jgi:stress response protein YsnF/sporulation protein YlmC with PRC-barrel domain
MPYLSGDRDSGGDVTMTMHAQELMGARVTASDGEVVGTVEQVFNDDVDGQPVWARVRAGRRTRFVPLGGSTSSAGVLSVPFQAQQIMGGPDITAAQHMSAAQAEQLSRHYGLMVPSQPDAAQHERLTGPGPAEPAQPAGGPDTGQREDSGAGQDAGPPGTGGTGADAPVQAPRPAAGPAPGDSLPDAAQPAGTQLTGAEIPAAGQARAQPDTAPSQPGAPDAGQDWLVRTEERINVATELRESGRVRIHKYVDVEPVEQAVHVYHEEYEIEHVPITADEVINGTIEEGQRELILHEQRAVFRKEVVPVERVRLVPRRVEEDTTIRDELRKERIEVEDLGEQQDGPAASPPAAS